MKKIAKVVVAVIAALLVIIVRVGVLLYMGLVKGKGPLKNSAGQMAANYINNLAGNAEEYLPENAGVNTDSPLSRMNICFLGSSVTVGTGSGGHSFVEVLAQRNGFQ